MARVRGLDYLLGIEGLSILRNWKKGPAVTDPRIDEIARFVAARDRPAGAMEISEFDAVEGYAAWVSTYDAPGNPLVAAEEPVVRDLIAETRKRGRALDVACGTGRHTRHLAAQGFEVVGVDLSPQMLEKARTGMPEVRLCRGDIAHLPVKSNTFDLAVCTLALEHVANLDEPMREMARVLRAEGCGIVSMLHPMNMLLGHSALFQDSAGNFGTVRGFYHGIEEFVAAFFDAGLEIIKCVEPLWDEREVAMVKSFPLAPDAMRSALCGTPLALVWLVRKRA